jgi:hypothetical protein
VGDKEVSIVDPEASELAGRIAETYSEGDAEAEVQADVEADPEEVARNERAAKVAAYIRAESKAERLVDPSVFIEEPFSFSEDDLAEVWEQFASDDQYVDIVRTTDEISGVEYLHAEYILSVAFAKLMLRKQANDPKRLIAEVVRENSDLWPRPVSTEFFSETELFEMTPVDVANAVAAITSDPAYADVKGVTTSNGVVYLYSDRYLDEPLALNMAEWIEVDSKDMYNQ